MTAAEAAALLAAAKDDVGLGANPDAQPPVPPHIPAGGRGAMAGLRAGIHHQRGTPLDASHLRRDFRLCAEGWYRGHVGTARTAAHLVSVMSESGVDVDEIAWLARQFNSRTTETIYRHELRTVITTGTDVMDRICIQPGAPVCGV